MNNGLIPRRYAKALYLYAREKGADKEVYDLCGRLVSAFLSMPDMNKALTNPFVSSADKGRLVMTAAEPQGAGMQVFADFLKLLTDNNRIEFVRDIAVAYREIYRKENNIHRVTVTSAAPLSDDGEARLRTLIQQYLNGAKMEYRSHVNPDLIGGFTVAVDNDRLDASVANTLRQLGNILIKK